MGDVSATECDSLLNIRSRHDLQTPLGKGIIPNVPIEELPGKDEKANLESSQSERSCFRRFLATEIDDVTSLSFWRACAAEFLGTFLLCFYHIGVGLFMADKSPPPLLQVASGMGFYVAVVVTALNDVSGCQMNPAVTLGFAALRHVSLSRAFAYTVFQCVGAVSGSLVLKNVIHPDMVGNLGIPLPGDEVTDKQAVILEAIITSFLLLIVMAVSDKGRSDIQGSIPLIVGLTVVVNTLLAAPISGACMNPARALGPAVVMADYSKLWIYLLGPCVGALVGSFLYDKLFSVGADSRCSSSMCLRSPSNAQYNKVVKKEVSKLVLELETSPEDRV